jgi:hypothetical protein
MREQYYISRQTNCRDVTYIELALIVSGSTFVLVQNLPVTLRATECSNVSVKYPASYFRVQDGCSRFYRKFRTHVPRHRQQFDTSGLATGLFGLSMQKITDCVANSDIFPRGYLSRYSDSLRDGWSGDRIPVGAKFSAPVQNGPGAHPASYNEYRGFPGDKAAGAWR